MRHMYKALFVVSIASTIGTVVAGWGRFTRSLPKKLGKSELAVVMFYREDSETEKIPGMEEKLDRLEDMFDNTSDDDLYDEADIAFIDANIAKERNKQVVDDFGITVTEPTFVLFKDSVPLKNEDGTPIMIHGTAIARRDLKDFINKHLSDDIERILKEKAEIRKRKLQEAEIRRSYWRPNWGGYRPYYYWSGPYWRSPHRWYGYW